MSLTRVRGTTRCICGLDLIGWDELTIALFLGGYLVAIAAGMFVVGLVL